MPEIMAVLNDAEDRALHAGRVLTIPTYGAPFVHITLAGKRIRLDDGTGENGASAKPSGVKPGPTLNAQRGACPYCDATDVLIAGHIRSQHPDKPILWTGPNPVKCSHCERTFPTKQSMMIHSRNVHRPTKRGKAK